MESIDRGLDRLSAVAVWFMGVTFFFTAFQCLTYDIDWYRRIIASSICLIAAAVFVHLARWWWQRGVG